MNLMQMSLSGAVMILVIAVIRALAIHKLPKKAFLALWGAAAVRLLIPYSFRSALSIYSLLERLAAAGEAVSGSPAVLFSPIAPAQHVTSAPDAAVNTAAAVHPWVIVWAAGALICALFFAAAYLKCRREFKMSLPVDNEYVKDKTLRKLIVNNYIAFFRIGDGEVQVVRVLYGMRNYQDLL